MYRTHTGHFLPMWEMPRANLERTKSACRVDQDTRLREGLQRSPNIAVRIWANSIGEECHVGKVHGRRLGPRHDLLSLDPDSDRCDICPRGETVLGSEGPRNAVYLSLDIVFPCIPREDIRLVFELVLLVGAASERNGCHDAVCDSAGAPVDVPGVERKCCGRVRAVTNKLSSDLNLHQ